MPSLRRIKGKPSAGAGPGAPVAIATHGLFAVALASAVAFGVLAWWHAQRARELGQTAKAPPYATLSADPPARTVIHQAEGQVLRVDPARGRVTIAHKDIPGFMQAMTMTFRVKDRKLLDGIKAGDNVEFQLEVTARSVIITSIKNAAQ